MLSSALRLGFSRVSMAAKRSLVPAINAGTFSRSNQTAAGDSCVKYNIKDGVAVVKFDTPDSKVNVLSEKLTRELVEVMQDLENNQHVNSVVLASGKPGCWVAGADINMLLAGDTAKKVAEISANGQKVMQFIEDSAKPYIAAIMGTCLGGGLELALCCHYRVAVDNPATVLSAPEVMLGLLPGAGGTQRLPKLVGLPDALDMMLTGKNIKSSKAKRMGLVDQLIKPLGPGLKPPALNTLQYLEDVAVQTAKSVASGAIKPDRSYSWANMKDLQYKITTDTEVGRNYVFKKAKETVS